MVLISTLLVMAPLAAPARAQATSCGPICLMHLSENQWVSDWDISSWMTMTIYSTRATQVCRVRHQKPRFVHDKLKRRQRFTCA